MFSDFCVTTRPRRHVRRLGLGLTLSMAMLAVGAPTLAQTAPVNFDIALKGVKFDPAKVDGNLDASGKANGLLDADEMALVAKVLNDPRLDLRGSGGVDHARVQAAYDQALALIFPSLEEGFGWPVLEAMARGCPVFTSNRAPLTEVGGDAVEYIDPENSEAAAEVISNRLRLGAAWREQKSAQGHLRAQTFSTERFSMQMRKVYESVLNTLPNDQGP